jgi:hypothetical protein
MIEPAILSDYLPSAKRTGRVWRKLLTVVFIGQSIPTFLAAVL